MTGKTKKQLGLLGVLVAAFVVVMFVRSSGEGPAAVSAPLSNRTARSGAQAAGVPQVTDVNLEALKGEHDAPADPARNLFVFRPKAPPPSESAPRSAAPPPTAAAPVPTGPPGPPPIQLHFIGVLERPGGGGKVAILSDGRGNTFHGREGEDVDGRYRVIRIGTDSIELSYVDGRGRQTLRLSGQ
jgi:hypothetical protein